jgi:hypothetical protein
MLYVLSTTDEVHIHDISTRLLRGSPDINRRITGKYGRILSVK